MRSVDGGGKRLHLDTADASAIHAGELDVSLVTPSCVPRVLDEPVIEAAGLVSAVADGEHGVIKIGTACCIVHDTALVMLEALLVGLNRDCEGLGVEGSHHLANVVWGH